jgi:hypothetical protein
VASDPPIESEIDTDRCQVVVITKRKQKSNFSARVAFDGRR